MFCFAPSATEEGAKGPQKHPKGSPALPRCQKEGHGVPRTSSSPYISVIILRLHSLVRGEELIITYRQTERQMNRGTFKNWEQLCPLHGQSCVHQLQTIPKIYYSYYQQHVGPLTIITVNCPLLTVQLLPINSMILIIVENT